jgi:hypothetical protein
MRFYLIAAAASTLVATSAFAAPAGTTSFERDGTHYDYVDSRNSDGSIDVKGKVEETGESFALHVDADGSVRGTMASKLVSFTASKATMAALRAQTATTIASN